MKVAGRIAGLVLVAVATPALTAALALGSRPGVAPAGGGDQGTGDAAAGAGVFVSAGCSDCHTLVAVGATGSAGPDLDKLEPTFATVVDVVTYGAGRVMPAYRKLLSKTQIRDVAAFVAAATEGLPVELLPDLDIVRPRGLSVKATGAGADRRVLLGFPSSIENVGPGPLAVRGERLSTEAPELTAGQVVSVSDGTASALAGVGVIRFGVGATADRWGLAPLVSFELHRVGDSRLVRRGVTAGSCLADRFRAPSERGRSLELPNVPPAPVFGGDCGRGQDGLTTVEEGVSVGYGVSQPAFADGQSVDVTNLKAGRYLLVHRVNPARRLREASYANNVSSALISITWPRGASALPRVRILAACSDAERCEKPA